jgi:NAD(P)-dependent dehydrogenase (short-subunit alcohol dehydrogenase family)
VRFKEKVVVVTGGGSGIGRATAEAFGEEGASVVVVDLDQERANAVAQTIIEGGGRAIALAADVSSIGDAERIAQSAVSAFQGIHVLVNNAGIQTYGTVVATKLSGTALNINLKGSAGCQVRIAGSPDKAWGGRQYRIGAGSDQPAARRCLCGQQGRRAGHDADHGVGPRAGWHPRKCRIARLRRHVHAALGG